MTFDYMATAAGVLYCLGIYLHYIHVATIFHLLEREGEMNVNRARMHSLLWPWTVIQCIWHDIFGAPDDD
jgi:hypothetical protein